MKLKRKQCTEVEVHKLFTNMRILNQITHYARFKAKCYENDKIVERNIVSKMYIYMYYMFYNSNTI